MRNHFLGQERHKKCVRMDSTEEHPYEMEQVGVGPSQEHAIELAEALAAMEKLPAERRRAIELVVMEGCDCSEAAEIMGVRVGTIKSRVARGRTQLEKMGCRW